MCPSFEGARAFWCPNFDSSSRVLSGPQRHRCFVRPVLTWGTWTLTLKTWGNIHKFYIKPFCLRYKSAEVTSFGVGLWAWLWLQPRGEINPWDRSQFVQMHKLLSKKVITQAFHWKQMQKKALEEVLRDAFPFCTQGRVPLGLRGEPSLVPPRLGVS